MGVSILTALVLTELASNTAATSMLVPVVIAIAHSANFSPVPPVLAVCMAASLAFVLPVSTPPQCNCVRHGTSPHSPDDSSWPHSGCGWRHRDLVSLARSLSIIGIGIVGILITHFSQLKEIGRSDIIVVLCHFH